MKHKKIEKFILNIFRVLPLLCLLLFMLYVCLTGFTKVKTNTYDNSDTDNPTDEITKYQYNNNFSTKTIRVSDGYELKAHLYCDENCYEIIQEMYNTYEGYYVDIFHLDLIGGYAEYSFESITYNQIHIGGQNVWYWEDLENFIFCNDYTYGYGNNGDDLHILVDIYQLYDYLEGESWNGEYSGLETYFLGEGYLYIYDVNYSTYEILDDDSNFSIVDSIKYYMNNYIFKYTDTLFNGAINTPLNAFTNAINLNNNSIYYSYIKFSYLYLIYIFLIDIIYLFYNIIVFIPKWLITELDKRS